MSGTAIHPGPAPAPAPQIGPEAGAASAHAECTGGGYLCGNKPVQDNQIFSKCAACAVLAKDGRVSSPATALLHSSNHAHSHGQNVCAAACTTVRPLERSAYWVGYPSVC